MKIIDPREFFFPNLVSFLSYLMLFIQPMLNYFYNQDILYAKMNNLDVDVVGFVAAFPKALAYLGFGFVCVVCLLFFLIEIFIRKQNKSEFSLFTILPSCLVIPYSVLFYAGIILGFYFVLDIIW